jgi:hypothetical protein
MSLPASRSWVERIGQGGRRGGGAARGCGRWAQIATAASGVTPPPCFGSKDIFIFSGARPRLACASRDRARLTGSFGALAARQRLACAGALTPPLFYAVFARMLRGWRASGPTLSSALRRSTSSVSGGGTHADCCRPPPPWPSLDLPPRSAAPTAAGMAAGASAASVPGAEARGGRARHFGMGGCGSPRAATAAAAARLAPCQWQPLLGALPAAARILCCCVASEVAWMRGQRRLDRSGCAMLADAAGLMTVSDGRR